MREDNNGALIVLVTVHTIILLLLISFDCLFFGGVVQENREILKQIQAGIESQKQPIEDQQERSNIVEGDWGRIVTVVIQIESSGDPKAVSRTGARGLMQIMKPTWDEMTAKIYGTALSFDKAFDPEINRKVGTYYLRWVDKYLRNRLGENYTLAGTIMSYNCGIGNYCKHIEKGKDLPEETINYLKKFNSLIGE